MATSVMTQAAHVCQPYAAPASRASWCGQLRLGDLCVPVKAYAAIATPPENPLRQLHAGCGQRIEYRKWCPKHGAVPPEEIVKGYPYQSDQYVELSQNELDQLQPSDDKTIHVEHFLKPSFVDPVLFAGRSLYLAPANPAAGRPFAMVRQAMERSGKWGLGRVVLSNRWHIVIIRPIEETMLMHTLHHPAQCRVLAAGQTADARVTQSELRPLLKTINGLNGTVAWDDYKDDAEHRLTKLVESRVAAAQRPRASRSNGRQRSGNGRSRSRAKTPATNGTSTRRRMAA
jgi:DNA end-binding protein Ku